MNSSKKTKNLATSNELLRNPDKPSVINAPQQKSVFENSRNSLSQKTGTVVKVEPTDTAIIEESMSLEKSYHSIMLTQQQIMINEQSTKSPMKKPVEKHEETEVRSEKIRVAVRVRPQLKNEIAKENVCHVGKSGKQIRVQDMAHTIEGAYDQVYGRNSRQPEIYQFVSDCIPNLLQGFNCTIFAYGQTGSGKTYTMFGNGLDHQMRMIAEQNNPNLMMPRPTPQGSIMSIKPHDMGSKQSISITNGSTTDASLFSHNTSIPFAQQQGIIPRCISELYSSIKNQGLKITIYCSFLQIYNEKLYDLFQDTLAKHPLQIREDKLQGIYVEGLSEYIVQSEADCMVLLTRGEKNRIKRSTKMNIKSSRSHSLFQLLIETDQVDAKGMLKRSKLNLGDLAGSEKINKDEEMQAKHMLELRNINLSLTTLGKVIQQLSFSQSSQQAQGHIPFRESKLTRLLQDSIGGNTSTYLIATVSPIIDNIEETISTLKFADRAKCVMQRVKRNEINAKDDALVQKLQREVQYLKELLQLRRKGKQGDISQQLYILKDENDKLRQMAMNYDDIEKMRQENKQMRLELQKLKNLAMSEFNASGNDASGEQSPVSYNGRMPQKGRSVANTDSEAPESMSESEDIQLQFQKYQSQADLVVKDPSNSRSRIKDLNFQKGMPLAIPEIMTERAVASGGMITTPQRDRASVGKSQIYSVGKVEDLRAIEIQNLKQSRYNLQKLIEQEHMNVRASADLTASIVQSNKRYRNESTDLTMPVSSHQATSILQFPAIGRDVQGPSPLQMIRINSNIDLRGNINRLPQQNPYFQGHPPLVSQDSFHSYDLRTIQKHPNSFLQAGAPVQSEQRNFGQLSSMRKSMHSINHFGGGLMLRGGVSPPSIGKVSHSSVYSGGILPHGSHISDSAGASHYYQGGGADQSPRLPQAVVRIRGKNNQTIETRGSLVMTLEEEKRNAERRRQIRRSNDRLRMLENMERERQEKLELELTRASQEKQQRKFAAVAIQKPRH